MIKRDLIIKYIYSTIGNDIMEKSIIHDELANGVQISGGDDVNIVTLGVTCNEDFLKEATKRKSNFSIFHHGFDVRTWKSRYSLSSQKRLKLIYQNDMTIVGLHYALDAHPLLGNNATIIRLLGGEIIDSLFETWGFVGEFESPIDVHILENKCKEITNHSVFAMYSGPSLIKRFGVVSGAGKPYPEQLSEMEEKGIELFITGEPGEGIPYKMKESNINYFACGHYATEVFGVKELEKVVEQEFGKNLKVEFIDIPNPI
jgi:dinuclear metal center YbgI/SA1388 family protein